MIYHVIGTMSGSSMDGLDLVHCTLEEVAGQWTAQINQGNCIPFNSYWEELLPRLHQLPALDLMLAHTAFGKWCGQQIASFIEQHQFQHKVHLIASHGHTVFHEPQRGLSFQIGDGAAIAATCQIPVVSDLRNMDVALGGQGAPIVPIAEKYLWPSYPLLLNLGGICNISINLPEHPLAFDVCAANRVLNTLASRLGHPYDEGGRHAQQGRLLPELFEALNTLAYYQIKAPKSLNNSFGTETVLGVITQSKGSTEDLLHTYCEHIAHQIAESLRQTANPLPNEARLLATGGGACNTYLMERIQVHLAPLGIIVECASPELIHYKEALAMALIGVLRWREENNVLASVTGASRDSIGGALWIP